MKYLVLFLALLPLEAAAQWYDNFSDGNFNLAPVWKGDSAKFVVNASGQLQLNAPAVNGSAYISTPSAIGYKATWNFLVKMDFNPSASNYAKVYLMSDQSDLTLPFNGYYLRIGGTNDDLCLFRQEGDIETLIADGRDKIFNTTVVNARINVTRDELGTWELSCDTTGGENYSLSATAVDNMIWKSTWFGVQCVYSSTRSTKFYFDDFVVTGEEYIEPKPQVDSTQLFDVVFNEIMADPTPATELPESEYLELFNRSGKLINMKDWKLSVGSYSYLVPEAQIPADGYLIITSKVDVSKFSLFGNVLGLLASSTVLNNTGQYLKLENRDGRLIAWVEYDDSWYGDEFKAQGGWSLEQIDPWNPCGGKTNWKASTARSGGTPGSKNSVSGENPDLTLPDILSVNILKDTLIELYFNEPVDSITSINTGMYNITPDIGTPKQAKMLNRVFSAVQLTLENPLAPGKTYSLQVLKNITDCAGHQLSQEISIPVGLPLFPDSGDVVINEVLFNAKAGGADYIELYNRSPKIINARNLLIGTKTNGNVGKFCRLSETGFLMYPSAYIVISENGENVKPFYPIRNEKCFTDLDCMPSLDDKASTLVLVNDTFGRVDEFSYSEAMHLPTLKNVEGISLERVNPNKPSFFPGNWHSAAETADYGTPGYKNSQYLADTVNTSAIVLSNDIFSPDNDGYNDIQQIFYKFNEAGCRAQVCVFDAMGRLVKRLLNNELLGTEGSFTWDGTSDAGKLCNVGMYVIFIRTVFDDGTVKEYKRPCVLALKR